jgi:uncharacterized protein (TIGR00255 family)
MILSMTAFSSTKLTVPPTSVNCEIRACNSKALDISLRITPGYSALEEKVKSLISEMISRGRLDILIQISETAVSPAAFEIDEPRALAYYQVLTEIKERFSLKSSVSLQMMAAAGIIKPSESEKDMDAAWAAVQPCTRAAVCELVAMRRQEGEYMACDIRARLEIIENQLTGIETESEGIVAYYQERLMRRIQKITQGIVDIDPGRMAQEAAFLADRSDISEEIVRARSHIIQFHQFMDAPEPAGRKLNFLLQEMNREFNTMGSKTENASVSYRVVEVKTELEKIREQVQNIE